MKNKLFVFMVLAALAFAVFTQSDFSRFLLGFAFLLWIALFVWARILCRYVDKSMSAPPAWLGRDQELAVELLLKNGCRIPVSEILVALRCRDEYSGEIRRLRGTAMLDGRDETLLRFVLKPAHYGILTFWPEKIEVADPLGISFASSRFPKQLWEVVILPSLETEQKSRPGSTNQLVETGDGSGGRGREPGAAYELRTYQAGEPLRNVHWKMSAKTDEMMVKEFIQDTEPMTLVFLDLQCGEKTYSRKDWDAFLEAVASFAAAQLRGGYGFQAYWLDGQGRRNQMQVRSEADARQLLTALLREKAHFGTVGETAIKENMTYEAYDAVVRIDLWGRITREEEAR